MCPLCYPAHPVPFEKGSVLKGKNLLLIGSKFYPFRVDHVFRKRWEGGGKTI